MCQPTSFPFVVLESRDGCGKTTISKELTEILGGTLVKTPMAPVDQFRKVYDCCENYTARYLYYLSTLVLASQAIEVLLETGPIVCDRYLYSAVVYHQLLGVDTSVVDTEKLGLVVPTLTVCLTCDEAVVAERLRLRGEIKDDHIEDQVDLLGKVDRMMRELIAVHVDTSETTPRQAALQIAAML